MTTTSIDSITVTSRRTVLSATEASWTALDSPFRLGPLDSLILPFIPVTVVFVYEQPISSPDVELIQVERLHRALMLLLDYYPHLTGRLHINPSDGIPEVTRLGTGAELLEARCSKRLDAFLTPGIISPSRVSNLPDAGKAMLPPFDATTEGICRDPILTVQHTRFACGSVVLGVRLLHIVCDADGFFQLVRHLAELYRGIGQASILDISLASSHLTSLAFCQKSTSLSHPPHIRSYMSELDPTPEERQAALDFQPSLYHVEQPSVLLADVSSSSSSNASFVPALVPNTGRFMRFSSRELKALKAHATDPNGEGWISTFDALSAHLYQSIYRARLQLRVQDPSLGKLSPPHFLTPVNLRSRLGLSSHYFPNALFNVYTDLPPDVLAHGPLWQVAKTLHDLTRTTSITSAGEMNRTLKWMVAQPDKRKIKQGFQDGTGRLMISQWSKFDMYTGTVFDVRPVLVAPPFTLMSLMDGLGFFYATEEQGTEGDTGAIDMALSLSEPLWGMLDQDGEFRRFA